MKGLFVTGTDTGVGKTHVAAALTRELVSKGVSVRVRKPIESGCAPSPEGLLPSDAIRLRDAAGRKDPLDLICPFRLAAPLSPPRAARAEGTRVSLSELSMACTRELADDDFLLVEGAGGFYSPIAADGLNADLAQTLRLPLLLVVGDRLGCINHTLLTIEAAEGRDLCVAALALSETQPRPTAQMDNLRDLQDLTRIPAVSFPYSPDGADLREPALSLVEALAAGLGRLGP